MAERTREAQRLEEELEDACIKLSAVVTTIQGVFARSMLEALVNRESDTAVMAELAQGWMRAKIDQLTEALTGRFNDHHRFMVTFRLQRIDQTNADIAQLDARIDELIAQHSYTATLDLLQSIPGLGKHGSEELLAEIGADMTVSPGPAHLAYWVGVAPGSHESAGVRKRVKTRPGNRYAKRALGIAGMSAARSKTTFRGARFRRSEAATATAKRSWRPNARSPPPSGTSSATASSTRDLGSDYYTKRNPERTLRRKIKDLEAAGYAITRRLEILPAHQRQSPYSRVILSVS